MKIGALLFSLLALAATFNVRAADAEAIARNRAATCTGCHGPAGVSVGPIPSLAGRPKEEISRIMREFREGKRTATVMHQHAKGYTDAQIDLIASWFAMQR
ncbi:MAG TPA: c-type cytochrome [Burkholderiales bacterium]|nr:c-type cytochrome [Burkholderiales bacterium]